MTCKQLKTSVNTWTVKMYKTTVLTIQVNEQTTRKNVYLFKIEVREEYSFCNEKFILWLRWNDSISILHNAATLMKTISNSSLTKQYRSIYKVASVGITPCAQCLMPKHFTSQRSEFHTWLIYSTDHILWLAYI